MSILTLPTHRTHRVGEQTGHPVGLFALVSALALLLVAVGCGGQTTAQAPTAPGVTLPPTVALAGIHMLDARQGWAVSTASVLRTGDGGKSWMDVTPKVDDPAVDPFDWPDGVAFLDAQVAWLAIGQPQGKIIILQTRNSGQHWDSATIDASGAFSGVQVTGRPMILSLSFVDAQHGWMLASLMGGGLGSQDVVVYRTQDGGASWALTAAASQSAPSPGGLPAEGRKTGLRFADSKNGWLTGASQGNAIWLYATHDGGVTWQRQELAAPEGFSTVGGSASTQPPVFFGPQEGLLPVQFHEEGQPLVFYVTHDGGAHWAPTTALKSPTNRSSVWSWVNAGRGFATDGEKLHITKDGGQTWESVTLDSALRDVSQLDFVSDSFGWALCSRRLYRTEDGGHTWQ